MTSTTAHAQFFGGPDDGATRLLGAKDFTRGFVETRDASGRTVRYSIVALEAAKQIDDLAVTHELRPTEGVW